MLNMPQSTHNKKSPMLTETQEKENNGNGNAAAKSRYSPHSDPHPHPGNSGAKRRPTPPRTPGTQQRQATAKGLSSERRPLKDLTAPTSDSDSGVRNGVVRRNSVEKTQGSNHDGLKQRLNGIGTIARGFINRDNPAIRGSSSLEAPKGCFGFLQSAKPVSSTVRKCSPTPIVRPVANRIRGDGIRTSDPKTKERVVEKNGVLPRSNSDGSRRIGGGSSWSRDRTPRSSNELNSSEPRSLKNSGEIGVKRSTDKGLKGSGEFGLKYSKDKGLKGSEEFGLKDSKDKGLRNSGGRHNSPSCPTAKSLGERKISRSGSLRTTPCHNGLKKNCGMDTRTAVKNPVGSYGLRKGVSTKSSDEVLGRKHQEQGEDGAAENFSEGALNRRRQEQVDDSLSNSRCASSRSCQIRAEEMKANLTAIGSPRGRTAVAVQRFQATSLVKVHSDYSHVTLAHKLIENEGASTPAHRLIGRYEDFTPAHKLVATNGDVTPAHAHAHALVGRKYGDCNPTSQCRIGKGGDATPAPHTIGKGGGDFTPAPNQFGKGGSEFTPAQNTMHATPEQRTQVTPPVQPSISPEIHSQSLDELEGARQCFGAGHVMAPVIGKVRDRRKCRPRGILTVGEATPLPLDHNRRFSLVPVPAAAYVKWMSPGNGKNLSSPSNGQVTPSSGQGTPSPGFCSQNPSPQVTPSPGFTQGTPSTFNSTNPSPQATPLSGFSQGTPSPGFSSKSPSPQATSLSGLTQERPPAGFSAKNPSPQAIPVFGLTQDPPTVLSLKNPIPQNAPIERFTLAAPLSFSSHFSNLHYTPPSSLSPEMQTFHPTPPFGFSPEMKNGNRTSPVRYSPKMENVKPTPYWFIEEMHHLHGTHSKINSNFQASLANPPFGLAPDCQHLQTTSPSVFNLEIPNCQVTHNTRSSPPASSQSGFHPHITPQCGDSQEAASSGFSTKIPSQFGCNPDTFPPHIISHGTPPSWNNQVVPSQLAVNSDVVRLDKPKASPVDKDICSQEKQMSISSSKDFTQTRISWREGLMSRIFELGELDCSDLILEEEGERKEDEIKFISGENHLLDMGDDLKLEYPSPFGNELQLDAPFGSFEYLNKATTDNLPEHGLSNSLVKLHISPASQVAEAESIDTEYVRTSSGDLDWTFWYRNQLFEEAA